MYCLSMVVSVHLVWDTGDWRGLRMLLSKPGMFRGLCTSKHADAHFPLYWGVQGHGSLWRSIL